MRGMFFAVLWMAVCNSVAVFAAMQAVAVATMVTTTAEASCRPQPVNNPCPTVPETTYQGGGVEVTVVPATVCFTRDLVDLDWESGRLVKGKGIVQRDGTYSYTVDFVYNPRRGSHEVIKTVHNTPCWTHNVAIGTWMAVYVTCDFYTGWVAWKVTGPTASDPRYAPKMRRVSWTFVERIG